MKILGVIPARYASTRLPGKPLVTILGKTMIQRVYEQAVQAQSLHTVVVATDDERIAEHVKSFGGNVVMTAAEHPSGTDRCFEAFQLLKEEYDYVINIQGDEPIIDPQQINDLAAVLDGNTAIATLIKPATNEEDLNNPGEVKLVLNNQMEALYFSRNTIPFIKGMPTEKWFSLHPYYLHVGMYAYRTDVLKAITQLPVSLLEQAESLEQLRWLENGHKIKCVLTDKESHCVDTQEDLEKVIALLRARK